jgi:hypothetical protein
MEKSGSAKRFKRRYYGAAFSAGRAQVELREESKNNNLWICGAFL